MPEQLWSLLPVLLLILAAEFVNGWTDAPNSIATVVSTRVLPPHQAALMATILNAMGALSGTGGAATHGQGDRRSGNHQHDYSGRCHGRNRPVELPCLLHGRHSNQRESRLGGRIGGGGVCHHPATGAPLGRMGQGIFRFALL